MVLCGNCFCWVDKVLVLLMYCLIMLINCVFDEDYYLLWGNMKYVVSLLFSILLFVFVKVMYFCCILRLWLGYVFYFWYVGVVVFIFFFIYFVVVVNFCRLNFVGCMYVILCWKIVCIVCVFLILCDCIFVYRFVYVVEVFG